MADAVAVGVGAAVDEGAGCGILVSAGSGADVFVGTEVIAAVGSPVVVTTGTGVEVTSRVAVGAEICVEAASPLPHAANRNAASAASISHNDADRMGEIIARPVCRSRQEPAVREGGFYTNRAGLRYGSGKWGITSVAKRSMVARMLSAVSPYSSGEPKVSITK